MRVWHARLIHIPIKVIKDMERIFDGLNIKKVWNGEDGDDICEGCMMDRSTVKSFPKSLHRQVKTKEALEIIHSDFKRHGDKILRRIKIRRNIN